jgi:hypothetical protein
MDVYTVALNPDTPLPVVADFLKLQRYVVQISAWLFSAVRWTSSEFDKLHGSSVLNTRKGFCLSAVGCEFNDCVNIKEQCPFSFAKFRLSMSLTCDEFPSRTISTFPLGFLGKRWSFSHVINI